MAISFFTNHNCGWACKNRACGHTQFSYFFNFYIHKILSFDSTVMILSEFFHSLSGMLMKVTECKYCILVLRYDLLSDIVQSVPPCPSFA